MPGRGEAVFRAGLGPRPVPIGKLSVKRLVHALEVMKDPQVWHILCAAWKSQYLSVTGHRQCQPGQRTISFLHTAASLDPARTWLASG